MSRWLSLKLALPLTPRGLAVASAASEAGYTFTNTEAETLVAAFSSEPDDTRKALLDTCIGAIKTAGVWAKLDVLQVYAAHDANASLKNWKNPGTFDASAVSAPTFAADRGYTGDGATSYLNTNFNPSTAGGSMAQDSHFMAVWSRTDAAANTIDAGSTNFSILSRSATNTVSCRSANSTAQASAMADGSGFTSFSRNASGAFSIRKNGVEVATPTSTSSAMADAAIYVCGRNNGGSLATPSTRQIAAFACGGYLSVAEDDALYDALSAYLTAVGA